MRWRVATWGIAVVHGDWAEEFRGAERRLKGLLLGDGLYMPGRLKGEEARAQVRRDLRRMRDVFDAALAASQADRAEEAEARIADLEEELKNIAASKARRARGVIEPPPAPSSKPVEASTPRAGSRTLKPAAAKTAASNPAAAKTPAAKTAATKTPAAKTAATKTPAAKTGARKVTKRQPKRSLEPGSPPRKKRRAG